MDKQNHQKIKDLINQHQHIGVIVGKHTSVDHVAAGLGLFHSLKQLGKKAVIVTPGDISSDVSFLSGAHNIKKTLSGEEGDLIIEVPYREGEIEKVSSELNGNYLQLIVKAGEKGIGFGEKEISFKRAGKPLELIFYIGIQKLSDIHQAFPPDVLKNAASINIDNRSDNQSYGDVVAVSPTASSVSEEVADFLTLMDPEINITTEVAQNLLTGIVHATNDFKESNTSSLAFEMAGILMKKGAQRQMKKPQAHEEKKLESTFIPQPSQHQTPVQRQNQPQFPQRQQQFNQAVRQQNIQPQQILQSVPQQDAQSQATPAQQPSQPADNPAFQQMPQSQQGMQPQQIQQHPNQQPKQSPPADWLAPKVYKGSTAV